MASSSPTDFDVRDHLLVLLRRKWIVLGSVLVFGVAALVWSMLKTPVYQCTAKVLIQRPSSTALFDPTNAQRINSDLVAEIELQFYNGDAVKRTATDKLGFKAEATASAGGRGSVMQITATDTNPQRCADIANRYAEAYVEARRQSTIDDFAATAQATQQRIDDINKMLKAIDQLNAGSSPSTQAPFPGASLPPTTPTTASAADKAQRDSLSAQKETLEKSLSELQISGQNAQVGGPQIISPASPPNTPVSPNPKRDTLIGALVGLLLGVAAAFLIDFLDDSIKSRGDLETATGGLPILTIIPFQADWRNRSEAHLVSIEKPASPTSEAYRTLRTSVQFAGLERQITTLQVTSPRSQDGKSTTSANLAVALARAGLRVVLVDCDLRKPRVNEFLGLDNAVGFTSVLLRETTLTDALQPVAGVPNLRLLASGPIPPNPSELLSGRRTDELVAHLRQEADIVVFDTPPVLPVSDAMVVSDLMDAVIIVVSAGSTTKKEAYRAWEMLTQVDAPLIGTVMNSGASQSGYGYGYGYGQDYRYGAPEPKRGLGRIFGGKGTPKGTSGAKGASSRPAPPREPVGRG